MKSDIKKRAELLAAMDCIMHHIREKGDRDTWTSCAVPDKGTWHILEGGDASARKRRNRYAKLAAELDDKCMSCVLYTFASIINAQCFNTSYTPGAFDCEEGTEDEP